MTYLDRHQGAFGHHNILEIGECYFKKTPSLSIARVKTSTVVIMTANGKNSMVQGRPDLIRYQRLGGNLSKYFPFKGLLVEKRINRMYLFKVRFIEISQDLTQLVFRLGREGARWESTYIARKRSQSRQ